MEEDERGASASQKTLHGVTFPLGGRIQWVETDQLARGVSR
jgi:hypothetical protein